MERIEINGEELTRIMGNMDDEGRRIFEKLLLIVASKSPLKSINDWLSKFEDDCPVDNLIARLVVQVIHNVGGKIWEAMDESKEKGEEHFTGHQAAMIAIDEVRKIADDFDRVTGEQCKHCEAQTEH